MIRVPLVRIQEVAADRPPGYEAELMSLADSIDQDHAYFAPETYAFLKGKYGTPPPTSGPGTELKKLLRTIGIEAKPGCACNKRAQTMDVNGCDWCAENLDTISSWLQEEADKRGLPYIPAAGKWIITLAIKRARRGIGQ